MARSFNATAGQRLGFTGAIVPLNPAWPLTLAGWVKASNLTPSQVIFSISHSSSSSNLVQIGISGAKAFFGTQALAATYQQVVSGGVIAAPNVWVHVAGVAYDANTRAVFLDGVKTPQTATTGASFGAIDATSIGAVAYASAVSNILNGLVAEVALWQAALTDDEIAALAKGFAPSLVRVPNNYYQLFEPGATDGARDIGKGRVPMVIANGIASAQDHPRIYYPTRPKIGRLQQWTGPPSAPFSPTPAHTAAGLIAPITLAWDATQAANYDVYFGTSPTPPLVSSAQTAKTYAATTAPGQTYYWQIVAKNPIGNTPGPVWSFSTLAVPAAPTGLTPANGSANLVAPITLAWGAVAGAAGYDIAFDTVNPPLAWLSLGQAPTSIAAPTTPGQTYYWQVRATNAAGVGAFSPVHSFTTLALPAVPHTPFPGDTGGNVATPVTLTWVAAGATGYDVYFGTVNPPPLVSSNQPAASYAPGIGPDGILRYWKIVARNAAGTTAGPVWSFTPALAAPATPTTPNPPHGATNVLPTQLTWSAPGATSYRVVFDGAAPVTVGSPAWTITPVLVKDGQPHTWQIEAINPGGSTFGPVWSFTTPPPDAAFDPHPTNGSLAAPTELTWSAAVGTTFDVYFGSTASPPLVASFHTTAQWPVSGLVDGTIYYWRIATRIGAGQTLGPIWSFTATKPKVPITPSPPTNSSNHPLALTLSWAMPAAAPVEGPMVFDVYFGTGDTPPLVASGLTTMSHAVGGLVGSTTYTWRVVARNAVGQSESLLWRFTTRSTTSLGITIEGEIPRVRKDLSIRDLLTDQPNTCQFDVEGEAPNVGQEVRVGLGTMNAADIIFGGIIDTVTSAYESVPRNRVWRVTAQDYTIALNRRKVRIRYAQQAAHLIALDLLAKFAPPNYTGNHIINPLPVVEGGIDFTEQDLTQAFANLAQRIGGYWYVDYERDIHLFIEEAVDAPDPIVTGGRSLMNDTPITSQIDVTQLRTRVFVEGGGSQARIFVPAGSTSIPVTDPTWYAPAGGLVVSGPQRIRYTGKDILGGPTALTATAEIVSGGALVNGPYTYKVAFVTSGGDSPLSPPSNAISMPIAQDPVPPVTIVPGTTTMGALTSANYGYRVSFYGPGVGETGGNQPAYKHTGAISEPPFSASRHMFINDIPIPTDPRIAGRKVYRTNPNPNAGSPFYLDTVIPDRTTTSIVSSKSDAELGGTAMQPNTTIGIGRGQLSNIPLGPAGTTGRRIYRTKAGGTTYFLVATLGNNTATTFTDNIADTALADAPTTDLATALTGIPASGDGAILYDILEGDEVNLMVQVDDTAAQAEIAALEGPPSDGIIEYHIQDNRLGLAQATATGKADLVLFARPIQTVQYTTRDPKTRSGKLVEIVLPEVGIAGFFTIQSVDIDQIDAAPGLWPRYRVSASSVRWRFEDALRRMQLEV